MLLKFEETDKLTQNNMFTTNKSSFENDNINLKKKISMIVNPERFW